MKTEELHDFIEKSQPNICQIVAYRDGQKIYDDQWNGYDGNDCTHIMSATKSVVSLLVGIAVDQGLIRSVDDKVLDYFPDYQIKRGEKTIQQVTIRHLLTMRAPYKCKGDPWSKVCITEDWTKTSLDILGGRKGLTDEFNYQTVCLHILTGLLKQVSGMTTVDYANRYLFEPLGIERSEHYVAKSAEEHREFTISKAPKKHIWFGDRLEVGTAGYGLCLSARDMAKIGLLCLNNGSCEDRQIVSSEWINDMIKPRTVESRYFRGMQYGYLWWVIHPEKSIYAAIGNSGNVIYINPEKNTVVAVTSYFKPTVFDRVDFIEDSLLPNLTVQ